MDQAHYRNVENIRAELDAKQAELEAVRRRLHAAILDSFPEHHGQPPVRGVVAELARRSKYDRGHVMDIRDGKTEPEPQEPTS